jgi:hypothetical protein
MAAAPFGTVELKARRLDADLHVEVTKLNTGWKPRVTGLSGDARDDGDVILGWLTRIVVGLGITAVIGFDTLSIGVAHVSATDDANAAARAASAAFQADHGDLKATLEAARASAEQHGETVVANSVTVDADGTVHLKIEHPATTLLVKHLSPVRSWARVVVSGSARYTAS